MRTFLSLVVGSALIVYSFFAYGMETVAGIHGTTFSAYMAGLGLAALIYLVPSFVDEFCVRNDKSTSEGV
ncbi:MAG: hypothetical protein QMC81_05745 [Thermoanaerobacterales bacterium]|nr:hypothetical protein [Bacillota bacterium]MDI6906976.1 hypothetical protein [Thermoanaerobacterales bacterium]